MFLRLVLIYEVFLIWLLSFNGYIPLTGKSVRNGMDLASVEVRLEVCESIA